MRPVVIAAGGTGGHFFPAEALAATLVKRGHRVVLMTDSRSGAMKSDVFAGLEQHVLRGAGLSGRSAARRLSAAGGLAAGTWQARSMLARLGASVVVGFGGYPSVPPVLAARLLIRRPAILLHEQNAVLGRANRFLARFADGLALGFSRTSRLPHEIEAVVTGNPVRFAILALHGQAYRPADEAFNLLVLGGSLGARVFSEVVPAAVASLPAGARVRLRIVQQCRKEDTDRVRAAYTSIGVSADLAAFFNDIPGRLAAAHLVIARAGASTCAEIALAGLPSILVPLPGAIDDHQSANAESLTRAGAAETCPQDDFTTSWLTARLLALLADPARLSSAAAAASSCGRPEAAADLADMVERLAAKVEAAT